MKLFWTKGIDPRHGVLLLTVAVGIALIALSAYDFIREYVAGIEAASCLKRASGWTLIDTLGYGLNDEI